MALWLKICLLVFTRVIAVATDQKENSQTFGNVKNIKVVPRMESFKNETLSYLESHEPGIRNVDYDPSNKLVCNLRPADIHTHSKLTSILSQHAKLIELHLTVANHSDNPLLKDNKWTYQTNIWARVAHSHAVTILSLTFNYGILSLMTLTFGIEVMEIELVEEPFGCLANMSESAQLEPVLDILLRDFNPDGPLSVTEGEGVCHQIIQNVGGSAKFTDRCCFCVPGTGNIDCMTDPPNFWLGVLNALLSIFVVVVFSFGPLVATTSLYFHSLDTVGYTVKLKEPLLRTMSVHHRNFNPQMGANAVLDLRYTDNFRNSKAKLADLQPDKIIPIKIEEFNIIVNYIKLIPENKVPVGLFQSLSRSVFQCQISDLYPFNICCKANALGCTNKAKPLKWISVCRVVGRILFVFWALIPFYVRLVLYYMFEDAEVRSRQDAAAQLGLPIWFNMKILQYITPFHPFYIFIYIMYIGSGIALACLSATKTPNRLQKVINGSIRDLFDLSWLNTMAMVTKNLLWPFTKFGIWGMLLGIVYWPIAIPVSLVVFIFYCVPFLYLSNRMIWHSFQYDENKIDLPGEIENDMHKYETAQLFHTLYAGPKRLLTRHCSLSLSRVTVCRLVTNTILAFICVGTLFSVMMLFTECASFVLRICVLTLMGVVINAGQVLKYGMLIVIVAIHSYDCYNNVYIKYLKFNRALFSEIRDKISDLEEVTSLPSYLQENRGFKSHEESELGEHEEKDNVSTCLKPSWKINDLILFVDNEDTPRIPRKLFEMVCDIKVAGSPGPVYLSLLQATGRFLIIVCFLLFVFIVVLTFGNVYQVSNTNQILATMAGGFMPFLFKNFFKPSSPQLELRSVSFKSKLGEILTHYWQEWPMFDFSFQVEEDVLSDSVNNKLESQILDDEDLEQNTAGQLVDICVLLPGTGDGDDSMNEWLSLTDVNQTNNSVQSSYHVV